MKKALRFGSCLWLLWCGAMIYGQNDNLGQNFGSLIYLDGVNVVPKSEITIMRDQLLLLEAFDLKPATMVDFRARSGPLTVLKATYPTDDSGAMHEILFFPKRNNRLRCQVKYTTKNGQLRKLEFDLKSVDAKSKTPLESYR
ncbi:MAG: hypothetical protein AAGN35_19090 [Bacteroidota bacterium]